MNEEPVEFLAISNAAKIQLKDAEAVFAENVLSNQPLLLRDSHPEDALYLERLRNLPAPRTCLELLKAESYLKCGSEDLDHELGGGINLKSITEICGLSGSGKTQLCLKLSVMSQLRESLGGISGRALVIDSNYGFTVDRYTEIRDKVSSRLAVQHWPPDMEPIVFRANGAFEVLSAIQMLRTIVENDSKIRVVIIDSFSRPFIFQEVSSSLIPNYLTDLYAFAKEFNVAVILTTQLRSKQNPEIAFKYQSVLRSGYSHYINKKIYLQNAHGKIKVVCSKNIDVFKNPTNISIDNHGIIL